MASDSPRKRSIQDLEKEPPKSLHAIRRVLRDSVREALETVDNVEREFVAPHRDIVEEIIRWVAPLKNVLHGSKVQELTTSRLIEQIDARIALPGRRFEVDPKDMSEMKKAVQKVLESVPDKFEHAISLVKNSATILGKYCLTFYDLSRDPPLDTAIHYTTNSMKWIEIVKKLIEQIRLMAFKFVSEVLVLNSQFFGSYAKQLASRCECEDLPFLLMFPQTCENLREACAILNLWIDTDENYAEFIKNDTQDLEERRAKYSKLSRELHEKCYHAQYRVKQLESEHLASTKEISTLRTQETNTLVAEELLRKEINEKRVDLEIKEFRKAELKRDSGKLEPTVFHENMNEVLAEIKELKDEMPFLQRKYEQLNNKLIRTQTRLDKLIETGSELDQARLSLAEADKEKEDVDRTLEGIIDSLELAKKIYLYKESPDLLEKMFYSIPIEVKTPRSGHHEQEKRDKNQLLRACHVVANAIGRDWCRLYRELPFEPARGELNIESDIANIVKSNPRDGHREQAKRGLYCWRRFHRRARLPELKDTLVKIKRTDVLEEVEERLAPPVVEVVHEAPPPPFLPDFLIPFYKEVERYDQLRASHKV